MEAGQQGHELGGGEAHLGGELHGLLPHEAEPGLIVGPEGDHRLGTERTVLGAAEGEHVHPGGGAERTERDAEGGSGVGDPGAVEVDEQPVPVGPVGQGPDLFDGVARAQLRALGDGDDTGLDVVLVSHTGEHPLGQVGGELPVGAVHRHQLRSEEPLGGAALVDGDVGARCADDRFVGAEEGLEADHVGTGAVERQVDLGVRAELPAEQGDGLGRQRVGAVGRGVPDVGGHDGRHDLGMDAGPVVAGERPFRRGGGHADGQPRTSGLYLMRCGWSASTPRRFLRSAS